MVSGRICTMCKEYKDFEFYHKSSKRKYGYNNICKPCKSETDKKSHQKYRESRIKKMNDKYYENREKHLVDCKVYRDSNKERIAEYKKGWAVRNRERKTAQERRWREANLERNKETQKAWYRNNRERVYATLLKRRSLKHFVRFEGVRRKELLDRDNWECQSCGIKVHDRSFGGNENRHLWDDGFKAHIDHIIPISKGGDSTKENLQVLCRTCNMSKNNKTDLEMDKSGQIKMSL